MFSKFLYKLRVSIITTIIVLVLLGIYSFLTISKESAPEINVPFFSIMTIYPGGDAKTIQNQITKKIEKEIKSISQINQIQSVSADNVSVVTVEFQKSKPLYECWNDLKASIDKVKNKLPDDAKTPIISKINVVDIPVYVFSIKWDYLPSVLYDKVKYIKDDIESFPGVHEVNVIWSYIPQIEIWFDINKLNKYNLKISQIFNLFSNYIFKQPIDKKKLSNSLYTVEISTYDDTSIQNLLKDLKNFSLLSVDWRNIKLSDVADVRLAPPFLSRQSFIDWQSAVTFQIKKVPWYDIYKLIKQLNDYLENQKDYLQKNDLKLIKVYSDEENINRVYHTFINNFWQTMVIILIVLFLFLWIKEAFGVFLAFPIVYLILFLYIYFKWYSFNNVVSFSLVLTLWIMVDNLIVISEWFSQWIEKFKDKISDTIELKLKAIQYSISTYRKPLIAGNLTTIAMFFPLNYLLTGKVGEFLKYMPVVVDATLLISMFVALVFLPVILLYVYRNNHRQSNNQSQAINDLSSEEMVLGKRRIERSEEEVWGHYIDWKNKEFKNEEIKGGNILWKQYKGIYYIFSKIFLKLIRYPKLVILSFIVLFILSFVIFKNFVKFDFLPPTDKNNIYVNVRYSQIVLDLETNKKYSAKIYELIKQYLDTNYPGVYKNILINVWDWTTNDILLWTVYRNWFNPNITSYNIVLLDEDQRDVSALEIYPKLNDYLKQKTKDFPIVDLDAFIWKNWPSAGKDFGIYIYPKNWLSEKEFLSIQNQLLEKFKKIPGTYWWSSSLEYWIWRFKINFDIDKVLQYKINPADLRIFLLALQNSLNYKWVGFGIKTFDEFGDDPIDMKMYIKFSSWDWLNTPIPGYNIYLRQIVKDFRLQPEIKYYSHIDWKFVIKIEAFKKPGVVLDDIVNQVWKIVSTYDKIWYMYWTDVKDMKQSMKDLWKAFLVGIILMIMVVIFYFNSFKYMFMVFSSIPLLLIGSFLLLAITQTPFSFPAQIGIFGLVWVGINNAILIVDRWINIKNNFLKRLKDTNKIINLESKIDKLLLEVVLSRLRPLFLTTLTTALGLLTLAFKYELWASLAYTFMGWLIVWFFIILIFVPALIKVLDRT